MKRDTPDATPDVPLKQETWAIDAIDWHVIDASRSLNDTLHRSMAFRSWPGCARSLSQPQTGGRTVTSRMTVRGAFDASTPPQA
jgi:hypothetical protein